MRSIDDMLLVFIFGLLIVVGMSGLVCMLSGCETTPIKHDNFVLQIRPDFPKDK